jgi:hypothetical protein
MDNSFRSDHSGKSGRSKSRDPTELKFDEDFGGFGGNRDNSPSPFKEERGARGPQQRPKPDNQQQQFRSNNSNNQQQQQLKKNPSFGTENQDDDYYSQGRGRAGRGGPQNDDYSDDGSNVIEEKIQYTQQYQANTYDNSQANNRNISPIRRPESQVDSSSIMKPLLLVDIDPHGIMKISKTGLEFLQTLKTNIAVLAVIGPYRTGKSFLMNRFAGLQKGFELGSSTNPCTKGIWLWGKPIKVKDNLTLLLLDTEGLCSYDRDENIDAKLFTLTALMSSAMIYNVMGAIDESAINSLSFIANLSKHINLNPNSKEKESDISKYFPNLIWSIRDFSLELVNKEDRTPMTPKEYMENALAAVQGDSEEALAKNKIRRAICDYFKVRDCFTLIRPLSDEKMLAQMEKVPYEKLRPTFREQLEHLINRVFTNIRAKIINDVPINGPIYAELLINYVDGLNNHAIPSIPSAWERIIDREAQKILQSSVEVYAKAVKKETEGKLPMNEENLNKIFADVSKKGEELFTTFKYSDMKLTYVKDKYFKKVKEINEMLKSENAKKSQDLANVFSTKLLEKLDKDIQNGKYKTFVMFTREFYIYRKTFFEEVRGPAKFQIFSGAFTDGFLKHCEQFFQLAQNEFEKEKGEIEKKKAESEGKVEALTIMLRNEKENAQTMIQMAKDRFEEQKIILEGKISDMVEKWEGKLRESERWREKLEEDNDKLRDTLNSIKNGGMDSKKANALISKALTEEIENMDSGLKKDIGSVSDNMKVLMNEMKKMNEDRMESKYRYEKEKDLLAMEKKYQKQLVEAKTLSDLALEELRASFQQEIEGVKEDNRKLERARENAVINLVEKEGEIKLLKEKILSYEKEKKAQLDHAEQMRIMSDKMIQVFNKMSK